LILAGADPGRNRADRRVGAERRTAAALNYNSAMAKAAQKPVTELSFEQALDELDALVRRMEAGEMALDDSIAAYKRGAELAKFCQAKLAAAEQEIKKLDGDLLVPLNPDELRGN
jgi:exodeoxyribonuclease VII small subunit